MMMMMMSEKKIDLVSRLNKNPNGYSRTLLRTVDR
jgi:hypothetical protein